MSKETPAANFWKNLPESGIAPSSVAKTDQAYREMLEAASKFREQYSLVMDECGGYWKLSEVAEAMEKTPELERAWDFAYQLGL